MRIEYYNTDGIDIEYIGDREVTLNEEMNLGIVRFQDNISRKDKRKVVHKLFVKSVKQKYRIFNKPKQYKMNRVYVNELNNNREEILDYSFSYADDIAVFAYSCKYDLGIDIVNPLRVQSTELRFFLSDEKVFRILKNPMFEMPVLSWCIQEAVSKLERTGLMKKYIITDILKKEGYFKMFYSANDFDSIKSCNLLLFKFDYFCIATIFRIKD